MIYHNPVLEEKDSHENYSETETGSLKRMKWFLLHTEMSYFYTESGHLQNRKYH